MFFLKFLIVLKKTDYLFNLLGTYDGLRDHPLGNGVPATYISVTSPEKLQSALAFLRSSNF